MAAWTAILLAAVRFLTGPRLLAAGLLFPFAAMEVAGGNVSLLLGGGDRRSGSAGRRPGRSSC